jgi:signal transduction histidine kinase
MKLNSKLNRTYFINSFIIFILAVISIFFITNHLIKSEVDEQLKISKKEIIRRIAEGSYINFPPFIIVTEIPRFISSKQIIKDTSLNSRKRDEDEPFRELICYENINNKNYQIIVRTSLVEKDDLFTTIVIVLSILLGALIALLIYINQKTTKEILKPFYNNMNKLRVFSLRFNDRLNLDKSEINEFTELNIVLEDLIERTSKEYNLLKEFTEDVNHELQTPIAVIKSKLELLLQNEQYDYNSLELIKIIQKNLERLIRINRSIILLSKLENKDFFESKELNLTEEIKKVLETYKDFAEAQEITLETKISSNKFLNINESLLNILLSNLISNSIKHNSRNGKTKIELQNDSLLIQNTGNGKIDHPEKLFERFFKSSKSTESLGLGLAIVHKICELYNYQIRYEFVEGMHTFLLIFD